MAKIMVNVQKRFKGASAEANFWYGENIDYVEKKAQNSEFHWNWTSKITNIVFFQIYVHELLASNISII